MYKFTAVIFFSALIFPGCISAQEKNSSDGLKRIAEELSKKSSRLNKKTIAVMPFETLNSSDSLGNEIPEKLTHELVRIGKFSVIERTKLNKILKEQSFSASGAIDATTAAKIGKLLSVEALVVGTVSNQGNYITARLVLTETGVILASSQYEVKGGSKSLSNKESKTSKFFLKDSNKNSYKASKEQSFGIDDEDEPEGKITSIKYFRSSNSLYFIGLVKNTGKVILNSPHFDVILKDVSGEQTDVIGCFGKRIVMPGEEVPFQCFVKTYKKFTSYEPVYEPRKAVFNSYTVELETSNIRFKRVDFGLTQYVITGTIQNKSDMTVKYPS
ncbi:MAG: FlgO family outer membrane protein, partial [Spirochaetia bacterium]|nr:FlgO family outer membrane protein [Spirochaetia bacterium]